jgi:hypothetical protein
MRVERHQRQALAGQGDGEDLLGRRVDALEDLADRPADSRPPFGRTLLVA